MYLFKISEKQITKITRFRFDFSSWDLSVSPISRTYRYKRADIELNKIAICRMIVDFSMSF